MGEIRDLFINQDGNQLLSEDLISFFEMNKRVCDLKSEIFISARSLRLIYQEQTERMVKERPEVISFDANLPCMDQEIFRSRRAFDRCARFRNFRLYCQLRYV